MSQKSLFGLIAAGATTLPLLIVICWIWHNYYAMYLLLVGLLTAGLCTLIRFINVLNSTGTINIGSLKENKKNFALIILGLAAVSELFILIGTILETVIVVRWGRVANVGWESYFQFACMFFSVVAGIANVLLAFLELKDSDATQHQQIRSAARSAAD